MVIAAIDRNLRVQNFKSGTFEPENFSNFIQKAEPVQKQAHFAQVQQEQPVEPKTSIKEKYNNLKLKIVNFIKTINNTTNLAQGVVKGVAGGAVATIAVGAVGKNIKQSSNSLTGTVVGIIEDISSCAVGILKSIPALFTKSPVQNVENLFSLIPRFYKNYMKEAKSVAVFATIIGVGVLLFNILKGKIHANRDNANVDHSVNTGHVPTK